MAGANADSVVGVPPTRFPNGINTNWPTDLLAQLGMPDPTKYVVFWEDFVRYVAAEWTITKVDGGTDGAESVAVTNKVGGELRVLANDADNDSESLQWKNEAFKFVAGKRLWFLARFKVSDATQSDLIMGLQITDTTPFDVTDGVYFQKDDGDALLDFNVEKNNTATAQAGVATLADDTYVVAGFYWNGVDEIEVFIDGVKVYGQKVLTNLVDDEDLCPSFAIQNGEAVAKSMTVDYILVCQER